MNRFFLVLLIFVSSSFPLLALESLDGAFLEKGKVIGFTIEPSFGYLLGQAREIVYLNNSTDEYLSELTWDLSNIFYAGISSSLNIKNKLFIDLGIWTNLNHGNGYMNDYDWLNLLGNSFPIYNEYDREGWTNWSLSSVEVLSSFIFDGKVSYNFLDSLNSGINVQVGYKYQNWYWTDKVIDSVYPPGWSNPEVGKNAIDYELFLNIPYIGVGGSLKSDNGFIFQGVIHYSPFTFGYGHDNHKVRIEFGPDGAHWYDYIYFAQFISGTIKTGYRFNPSFSLSMKVTGEYLFETRGDSYEYTTFGDDETLNKIYPGGAGIQYKALSISINAAISF